MNTSSGFLILALVLVLLSGSWGMREDPRKGWFWYKETVQKKKEEKKREEVKKKEVKKKKEEFEFPVREDAPGPVREFLKNPSEETAEAFLRWQYRYFKHLEKIGYALQQAYLKKGKEIYPIKGYPQNPLLAVEYHAEKDKIYRKVFTSLKDRIGLIYFFSSSCKFCEMEKPLIESLYYKYGISIRAVSVDGTIEDFPFPVVVNPDLARQMGVTTIPTIVLVIDTKDGPVIDFVGVGFTPLDLIESRIVTSLVVHGIISGQELNPNWSLPE